MASYSSSSHTIIILIALIATLAISPSLCRRERSERSEKSRIENDLRDLCSQTNSSNDCWKIIKPDLDRFNDTDYTIVADVILDLARSKGDDIHKELNRLYDDSKDEKLKYKYLLCSKNYSDAIRNLVVARRDLRSNDLKNIAVQIDDTFEELNSCGLQFEDDSFDPAHVRNRVDEFGLYVNISKVATDRIVKRD